MKRIFAMLMCAACLFILIGCNASDGNNNSTPPPEDEKSVYLIESITYSESSFEEVPHEIYVVDFVENIAKKKIVSPTDDKEPEFKAFKKFSDKDEVAFIDRISEYGLLDIDDNYPQPVYEDPSDTVCGEPFYWTLTIVFKDGTVKKSVGDNNRPATIFNNCSEAFYDLCGDGILMYVHSSYYTVPEISFMLYEHSNDRFYTFTGFPQQFNYKWNSKVSIGNSPYNATGVFYFEGDHPDTKYTLMLDSHHNNYSNYEHFEKCTVTSFDYNEALTNETVMLSCDWFKSTSFDLELNKIYVIRLDYPDGNYVEYMFNTKI